MYESKDFDEEQLSSELNPSVPGTHFGVPCDIVDHVTRGALRDPGLWSGSLLGFNIAND